MKPLKPLLYEAVVVSKQREALKKKLYKCQITFYILTKKHWGVGHVGQLRGWESYVPAYCAHQSMLYICCIKCTPSYKWLKVKGEGE